MRTKKPFSEKQLSANRANALRSTGPKSGKGKSAVRLNTVRHSLTGQVAVLPTEDCAAHESFCQAIIGDFAPANATELNIAQAIANDLWRLHARGQSRTMFAVGQLESEPDREPDHDDLLHAALTSARTFMDHAGKFGLLSLYERRINPTVHKNTALLRQMQSERRKSQETVRHPSAPRTLRPTLISNLQTHPAENGFVFANNEIASAHAPDDREHSPPPDKFEMKADPTSPTERRRRVAAPQSRAT